MHQIQQISYSRQTFSRNQVLKSENLESWNSKKMVDLINKISKKSSTQSHSNQQNNSKYRILTLRIVEKRQRNYSQQFSAFKRDIQESDKKFQKKYFRLTSNFPKSIKKPEKVSKRINRTLANSDRTIQNPQEVQSAELRNDCRDWANIPSNCIKNLRKQLQ